MYALCYYKLIFLYICFAMLHTTLHNETHIRRRRGSNKSVKHDVNERIKVQGPNETFVKTASNQLHNDNEEKIFDMIIPKGNMDVKLWPKVGNKVTIPYALDVSLSASQRLTIPGVLRSVQEATCIRFERREAACRGGGGGDGGPAVCFLAGRHRAAHLGLAGGGGPQPVTLAAGDGPFWTLHLVGHILGLPHPHTCRLSRPAVRVHPEFLNPAWGWRAGCTTESCRWRRFDPSSALQLTADELSSEPPLPSLQPQPPAALLAVGRARRAARLSRLDRLALNEAYGCGRPPRPCPARRACKNGGVLDEWCGCACPAGFAGADCGSRQRGPPPPDAACVRHLEQGAELDLAALGFLADDLSASVDFCVVSLRTTFERPRLAVSMAGLDAVSSMSSQQAAELFSEAILCTMKMYMFRNGSFSRAFCILDYLGEYLSLSVSSNAVDVLLWLDASQVHVRKMMLEARLVVRANEDPFKNLTNNRSAPFSNPKMRSLREKVNNQRLIILACVIFSLMGLNYVIIVAFRKYWERKYGTSSIVRSSGSWRAVGDEEEPEDWTIKVSYSDTTCDADEEKSNTGTPIFGSSFFGTEKPSDKPNKEEASDKDAMASNASAETPKSPQTKKRVSFSDQAGSPRASNQTSKESVLDTEERPSATAPPEPEQPESSSEDLDAIGPDSATQSPEPVEDSREPISDEEINSESSTSSDLWSSTSSSSDFDESVSVRLSFMQKLKRWLTRRSKKTSNQIQ